MVVVLYRVYKVFRWNVIKTLSVSAHILNVKTRVEN